MAKRDAQETRRRILVAGLDEFSEYGIAGARVDRIAQRSGANKRMIYYYFGSKEGLYRAIQHDWTEELKGRVAANAGQRGSLGSLLKKIDRRYTRLLLWEALQPRSQALVNQEERSEFIRDRVEHIRTHQHSRRRDDLDTAHLVLSEVFLVLGPTAFPQIVYLTTGYWPDDPEFEEARARFLDQLQLVIDHGSAELHPSGVPTP